MGWEEQLGRDWYGALRGEFGKEYFRELRRRVKLDRINHTVYPAATSVFKAYRMTPLNDVRVLILGQDPYHNGHAHGLAFGTTAEDPPASLRNIMKEIDTDPELDQEIWDPAPSLSLERLARQGVMLLNTALTVKKGEAGSHSNIGWEIFTKRTVEVLLDRFKPLIVLLWGNYARDLFRSADNYDITNSLMVEVVTSHPSPLSATKGSNPFLGSGCFSTTNKLLKTYGLEEINWTCDPTAKPDGVSGQIQFWET